MHEADPLVPKFFVQAGPSRRRHLCLRSAQTKHEIPTTWPRRANAVEAVDHRPCPLKLPSPPAITDQREPVAGLPESVAQGWFGIVGRLCRTDLASAVPLRDDQGISHLFRSRSTAAVGSCIVVDIECGALQATRTLLHFGVKTCLPLVRVTSKLILCGIEIRRTEKLRGLCVHGFFIAAHVFMWAEEDFEAAAGVIARMRSVNFRGEAEGRGDRYRACERFLGHGDRRTDVLRWIDLALVDDADGVIVAFSNCFECFRDPAPANMVPRLLIGIGAVDQKGLDTDFECS
jgi:hypothetical protein